MTSLVGALEAVDSANLLESLHTEEKAGPATVQGRLERVGSSRHTPQRRAQRAVIADAILNDSAAYLIAKRTIDIIGSVIGLILFSPLFAVLAVMTKLSDGGPIFYPHTRVGKWGREFKCFKFRTMVVGAERIKAEIQHLNTHDDHRTFKAPDDPRVTRLGRWLRRSSMDEMPQLWSVLRGDMSLVGPRPPVPTEVERYNLDDMQRLLVKPGLTCIWQVSGRSRLAFSKQLEMDLAYIQQRSLWLDVKLMLRTIPAVLSADGAY